MDKRFAFLVTVVLVMTAIVPVLTAAEPTRAGEVEIIDIEVTGTEAPEGELASGLLFFEVDLSNTGIGQFIDFIDFQVNITYTSNDTVFYMDSIEEMVYIPAESQASIDLFNMSFDEGEYHIMVNATIDTNLTEMSTSFMVKDVVDMSVMDIAFDEEFYLPGIEIIPMCNVTYEGNVHDYADTLEVNLVIDHVGEASVTVYDETVGILTPASPGVDPGKSWMVSFPGWTPNASGEYQATYSVYYDNTNETNNVDMVEITVEDPVPIEGHVMTETMDPIPGVTVTLSTIPEMEATTDQEGYYHFMNVSDGNYTLVFSKQWVTTYTSNVTVVQGETQMVDATMTPLMIGGLRGKVTLPDGGPAQGALVVVTIDGQPLFTINSNSTGFYQFDSLPAGNATVTASLSGFVDAEEMIILASQTWNSLDLELGEIPFNVTFSVPDGEPGVSILDHISVFFTRPIERTTVDSSTLILRELTTTNAVDVVYSFTDFDETVVITPSDPLEYSTDYQIEVTSWITDINGDYFPGPVSIIFTTEDPVLEVTVQSTYPEDDAPEIPIDATITAKFSVPMVGSTINGTTFKLFAQGGVVIPAVISYQASTWTASLNPISDLDYGTRYSVTLDPDIVAEDDTYQFYGESWSFETEILITAGVLKGKVVDEDNTAFPPSQVQIVMTSGGMTKIGQPKTDGTFEIIELEQGQWTITIKVAGYDDYTKQLTITAGETTEITDPIGMVLIKEDDGDGDDDLNYWIIGIIILIVIFIAVVLYLMYNRRQEPIEAEEVDRRPQFGRGRREPAYYDDYDDFAEGEFICPACGSVVEGEDMICPACGAEFEEDLFECPECGANISADVDECPECGAVFEEELPEGDEEEYFDEEEEVDITEDYEVDDMDEEDLPIAEAE